MKGHSGHGGFWIAIANLAGDKWESVDGLGHLWCTLNLGAKKPHLACRQELEGYVNGDLVWRADLPLCHRCLNVYYRHKSQYDVPLYPFLGEPQEAYLARLKAKFANVGRPRP